MATRRDIKNAFLSEIEDAVDGTSLPDGGTFSENHVFLSGTEDDDVYPVVLYEEFGFDVFYNEGSAAAPRAFERMADGDPEDKDVYPDYDGLRFDVTVLGSEHDKEPLYEAVRGRFSQFDTWRSKKDLHDHVVRIRSRGTNSPDDDSTEHTTRVDIFTVEVEFYRRVDRSGTPISSADTITDDGGVHTTT